jgi:hypothetical protein
MIALFIFFISSMTLETVDYNKCKASNFKEQKCESQKQYRKFDKPKSKSIKGGLNVR